MKIIFDILHPAHVHFFKTTILQLKKGGHQVIVTSRKKDHTIFLLEQFGIEHICLSGIGGSKIQLISEFLIRSIKLTRLCRREKPDLMIGVMGAIIAPVGKLVGVPTHVYYDTEIATLTNKYVYRLATKFITPRHYTDDVPKDKHVVYDGFKELAYLHPKKFIADPATLHDLQLKEGEPFFILRFVAGGASHDIQHKSLGNKTKEALVSFLSKHGRVIISAEGKLSHDMEKFRMQLPPHKMHDLLYYASLFIGEGGTMASEAAILGTPSIYVNYLNAGTLIEQEKLGLLYNFRSDEKVLDLVKDLVTSGTADDRRAWRERAKMILSNKLDLTELIIELAVKEVEAKG